jgi:hypothetical protein
MPGVGDPIILYVPLIANFLIADQENICVLAVSSANWPFSGLAISGTISYNGFNFR